MKRRAEIVIVGGGIIGCAIAYYLASKGKKPLLLERDGIGEGTSCACDGFVFMQTKKPGLQLELALASAEMYQALDRELGREVHYQRPGGLILIESAELLQVMEGIVAQQQAQGMQVELVDGKEARRQEPSLAPDLLGAAASPWDGHVNPIDVTLAYADAAVRCGAVLCTHTPVTQIKLRGGRIGGVVTPQGEIETDCLILAAGVWSPLLGQQLGLEIPVKPRRGQTLVTEPLPPTFRRMLLDSRYIAIKHHPEMARNSEDEFLQLGVGLSIEQTQHGNVLIGNSRDFPGYDTAVTYEVTRAIARYASRFIPFLQDVGIVRSFAGLRPYSTDGAPIVGPVSALPGLYLATGHEGDGVALAPITGKLVAQELAGETPEFDLSAYSFDRFATGRCEQ